MRFVTVVNRTAKSLQYTWLGKHQELKPGKHMLPEQDALAARLQNPIRGSADEFGNLQSYIGIVDEPYSDDVSEVAWNNDKNLELYNFVRNTNPGDTVVVIPGR